MRKKWIKLFPLLIGAVIAYCLLWYVIPQNKGGEVAAILVAAIFEGGNLAASKIRNLECPNYEICLIDYGCGKFNRKIHIMEQYP